MNCPNYQDRFTTWSKNNSVLLVKINFKSFIYLIYTNIQQKITNLEFEKENKTFIFSM